VILLRGNTGGQLWSRTGDHSFALLRAGRGRVPAVGVSTSDTITDADGTTETLELSAVDVSGAPLYERKFTLHTAADRKNGTLSMGVASAETLGDLQRDGARDGHASLWAVDGRNSRQVSFLFDGATGLALPGAHVAAGGSLTGAGDDLLDISPGAVITVAARSGRDEQLLFVTHVRPRVRVDHAMAYAARIRGRCDDLLLVADNPKTNFLAVLTATGVIRWSIEQSRSELAPKAAVLGSGTRAVTCSSSRH
jgi:hypothetical protein